MSKFEELKARINKEYEAVTNTLDAGNCEYAYEWCILDNLNDIVTNLEIKIKYDFFTDEEAYSHLCKYLKSQFGYLCVVAKRFGSQLPFTLAKDLLFSLTNLINEINERNN